MYNFLFLRIFLNKFWGYINIVYGEANFEGIQNFLEFDIIISGYHAFNFNSI